MSAADGDRRTPESAAQESRLRILVRATRSGPMARVLGAYFAFNAAELATWVAILVWAYDEGGAGAAGLIALVQLVPATLVAPFGAVLGDRLPRGRALALGYGVQALTMGATAVVLALDSSFAVVAVFAASAACSVTLTRPVHHAILPDLASGPAELTAANSASGTVDGAAGFVGPAVGGRPAGRERTGRRLRRHGHDDGARPRRRRSVSSPAAQWSRPSGEGMAAAAVAGFREVLHDRAAAMLVVLVAAQSVIVGLMDILVVVLAFDVLDLGQRRPGLVGLPDRARRRGRRLRHGAPRRAATTGPGPRSRDPGHGPSDRGARMDRGRRWCAAAFWRCPAPGSRSPMSRAELSFSAASTVTSWRASSASRKR